MPNKPIVFEPLTLDLIRKHFVNFDMQPSFYPINYYEGKDPNLNKELIYKDPKEVFNSIFIPNGNAQWHKIQDNFDDLVVYNLSNWLLTNSKQKNREFILLDGVLKRPPAKWKGIKNYVEDGFSNGNLQICDGNYIAEKCSNTKCWIQKLNKDEYPINNSTYFIKNNLGPYINDKYNTYKKTITYKDPWSNNFYQKNIIPEDQRWGYTKINYYKGSV